MSDRKPAARILKCLVLALLGLLGAEYAAAAPSDVDPQLPAPNGIELIAFEASGCIYCPVFRRDVVPSYAATRAGKTAPLRFIDINDASADALKLTGPVTTVPTLVLVRDGVEIGRISGYVGRENTHRILDTLLPMH